MSAAIDTSRINLGRRQFLITSTTALTLAGAVATAVPFLASWQPTPSAALAGLPARIDLKLRCAFAQIQRFISTQVEKRSWVVLRQFAKHAINQRDGTRRTRRDYVAVRRLCQWGIHLFFQH